MQHRNKLLLKYMGGPVNLFRRYDGSGRYSPFSRREAARQTRRALKAEAKRIVDEENENQHIEVWKTSRAMQPTRISPMNSFRGMNVSTNLSRTLLTNLSRKLVAGTMNIETLA